jgi:hypothetical protein
MPKHEDPPQMACHGCAIERPVNEQGFCDTCSALRDDDPVVTVQGRTMPLSELRRQAETDANLAAALDGDTVQDQIKAARANR